RGYGGAPGGAAPGARPHRRGPGVRVRLRSPRPDLLRHPGRRDRDRIRPSGTLRGVAVMNLEPSPRRSMTVDAGIVLFLGAVRRGEFESLHKRDLPLGLLQDTNSKARLGDVSGFAFVERFDFSRPL